ncbi:EscF/YscF/HrpA family type III secretion system needle major subunit [Yoonia sp. BS5-3]|uniref:EscF/YscF/HrpA family type III secretion system needle major subunit n=1 Tax=Yoonia phaeophyticola TaxID=3137369 RepID=A0ABZ2V3V3_9RHOB
MGTVSDFANVATGARAAPDFANPGTDINREGFDLIFRQTQLQEQMASIEDDIREIEQNTNLSDTEKMFSMQMAMNAWSAITNLRSNMLKNVSDSLKTIARNVA